MNGYCCHCGKRINLSVISIRGRNNVFYRTGIHKKKWRKHICRIGSEINYHARYRPGAFKRPNKGLRAAKQIVRNIKKSFLYLEPIA